MWRFILALCAVLLGGTALLAQNRADDIIGVYSSGTGRDAYKVRITKLSDGTYKGAVCWVADKYDASGNVYTDVNNPDRSLRSTPIDQVVIFSGLKFYPNKNNWGGTKIYDPKRGIRVNVTISFENARTLKVRGSVLGIGETETWIKE